MVAGFRRTVSLPMSNSTPNSPKPKCRRAPEKSHHVRSTSLPCRSHPLISQLKDEICGLRSWQSLPEPEHISPAWLCDGLSRLEQLHASADELFQLPQAQECLRQSHHSEKLLQDFLRLADAYGTFCFSVMELQQHGSEAQVAIRRRDDARLASCVRSQKNAEKALTKLASSIRDVSRLPAATMVFVKKGADTEIARILREVIASTAYASVSLFLGIALVSSVTSTAMSCSRSSCWMVCPLGEKLLSSPPSKKSEQTKQVHNAMRLRALEKLKGLEDCLGAVESKSNMMFRSLVNTRVRLLNIQTP